MSQVKLVAHKVRLDMDLGENLMSDRYSKP